MSKCGLDECDLYGGCMYDCEPEPRKRKNMKIHLEENDKRFWKEQLNDRIRKVKSANQSGNPLAIGDAVHGLGYVIKKIKKFDCADELLSEK